MFRGFLDEDEEDDAGGALGRFHARIAKFRKEGRAPLLRHHAYWLLHNCVAHPWLAVHPSRRAVEFHALTSLWLNRRPQYGATVLRIDMPNIPNHEAWFIHNMIAHLAIGLLPCKWTFDYHDKTAEAMGVPGWV